MEPREPSLITYLDDTSATIVSSAVSGQFYELLNPRGRVEWQLKPSLRFTGTPQLGTEVPALCNAVATAVRAESTARFIRWRVRASVEGVQQEWAFGVADEEVPHLHLKLDRLNSAIAPDHERLVAKACCGVVQRGLADFCWDAKSFTGDKVSLYAYFKRLAIRRLPPSLSDQQPGWEHSHFVQKLRLTLQNLRSDVLASVVTIDWHGLLAHMKAIDAVLSPEPNRRILEDLLKPLECGSQEWLNAR
jgi:hypothetical protein